VDLEGSGRAREIDLQADAHIGRTNWSRRQVHALGEFAGDERLAVEERESVHRVGSEERRRGLLGSVDWHRFLPSRRGSLSPREKQKSKGKTIPKRSARPSTIREFQCFEQLSRHAVSTFAEPEVL